MKFTVIIPTRERSDTLYYTLKTCVSQEYDNLEILVSDNCSHDNTREIVDSFKDKRIRYINTGKRISMSRNWEFALDHVNEGYFTFVGDDDGLLPDAVMNVSDIIMLTGTSAVAWLKVEYHWPSHPELRDYMRVPLLNSLVFTESKKIRDGILNMRAGYNRGPCFYNSFVHVDVAKRLKANSGVFFGSITPDVYSALATCSVLESFHYSTRPFSVNGASYHSNGTSIVPLNEQQDPFTDENYRHFAEIDMQINPKFPLIKGSYYSALAEAFSQANLLCFDNRLKVYDTFWIVKISRELSTKPNVIYDEGMERLKEICSNMKKAWLWKICIKRFPNQPSDHSGVTFGFDSQGALNINVKPFGINDVHQACVFAENLLGDYKIPTKISYYSPHSLAIKSFFRRAAKLLFSIVTHVKHLVHFM